MKLLVNCDHVFDCLTRGPFPSGSPDDDAVQRHLDACHECRQLAEALRPAVALLHEALPASEAADLPAYGQAEVDESLCERADGALAARIRQMLDRQEVVPRRISRQQAVLHALRFTAAAMLLAAFVTLLAGVVWPQGERQVVVRPSFHADHQPAAQGLLHLASLNLPKDCLPGMMDTNPAPAIASTIGTAHVCCTRCHAAGKEGAVMNQRAVAALQQSCIACHAARS